MSRMVLPLLVTLALMAAPTDCALAQAPPNPATPSGTAPASEPGGGGGGQRNTTLDFIVAFAGAALVLIIVCYPSRRY
ncbi:MAG: hypothetical protein NZO58_11925 [Gemmataceae bacterium]|nr:hypothetical protein [Gemmataceae bacterium]